MRQRIANQRVRKTMLCTIIALFTLLLPVALAPMTYAWVSPPNPIDFYGPYDEEHPDPPETVYPAYCNETLWYASHSPDLNPPYDHGLWYQFDWGDGDYTNYLGPYTDEDPAPPGYINGMPVLSHVYTQPGYKEITISVHDETWSVGTAKYYKHMWANTPFHTVTFEAYDQNNDPVTDPYNQPPDEDFFVTLINWGEWYGYTFQTYGDVYEWDHSFETATDFFWWTYGIYYSLDHMTVNGNPYTMGNSVSVTSDVSVVLYYHSESWRLMQISELTELGYTQNEIVELAKMGHSLGYTSQTIVEYAETCSSLGYAPERTAPIMQSGFTAEMVKIAASW